MGPGEPVDYSRPPTSARTASERRGHTSRDHGPNSRSDSDAHATPATGSTHRNDPDPPKCPYVSAELVVPVQCGDFASRNSKPSPQSIGRIRPTPGRIPSSPGNTTLVMSANVDAATSVG